MACWTLSAAEAEFHEAVDGSWCATRTADVLSDGKVAVAVIVASGTEPVALRRWFAGSGDIRNDTAAFEEVALFLQDHQVRSVAMTEPILGCPHEEGIDYPDGEAYPVCPFWAGRERPIVG